MLGSGVWSLECGVCVRGIRSAECTEFEFEFNGDVYVYVDVYVDGTAGG